MSNNKEIKYTGYAAQPSDYECPDGQLDIAFNCIPENDSIVPIKKPVVMFKLAENENLLFKHKVPGGENLIIQRGFSLVWLPYNSSISDSLSASILDDFPDVKIYSVSAIGNTLAIASSIGVYYILWKENSYIFLGSKPPFVPLEFDLVKVTSSEADKKVEAKVKIPAVCHPKYTGEQEAKKEHYATFTQTVFGFLNPYFTDKIANGYFYQPFFVRYAFRLYDGSHWWQSAPVLMLPSVIPPFVQCIPKDNSVGGKAGDMVSVTLRLILYNYFRLSYSILIDAKQQEELSKWKDIISGIDVFVSSPIYTYDQSKDLEMPAVPIEKFVNALQANTYGARTTGSSDDSGKHTGEEEVPGSSDVKDIDVDQEDHDSDFYDDYIMDTDPNAGPFIGHYCDNVKFISCDHFLDINLYDTIKSYFVPLRPHSHFIENIHSCHDFYKIASLDFDEIKVGISSSLKLDDKDLRSLVAKPVLSDDYRSHCVISAKHLYAYNSRLNMADIELNIANPLPIRSIMPLSNAGGNGVPPSKVRLSVWCRINGQRYCSVREFSADIADTMSSPLKNMPRFLFYPDSSAYKMKIEIQGYDSFWIELKPHDFLNGAYYFKSNLKGSADLVQCEPEQESVFSSLVPLPSKLYTSEADNPFLFPVTGINTIGTGKILGLSSAAKALSQGQFGQFPLYAFTDEGVWAMEVSSTGTYSAKQPITRDVCINPDGITQIDSAVLFPSKRGIMIISGSNVQCLSDIINTNTPFEVCPTLPQMDKLHQMMGDNHRLYDADGNEIGWDSCMPAKPFLDFLESCRMVYDYVHQRIIVYNSSYTYAYVYSMKSQQWGMIHSDIKSNLNSYPKALAVTHGGKVIDFCKDTDIIPPALLVTRPLKLVNANVLKTVDTVIQRGNFRKGHVQSVLYGSRDLVNWHLVWSSKDHFLRGFRGSPYKYYRIALLCNLDRDESIFGASVQFTPKLINQPR